MTFLKLSRPNLNKLATALFTGRLSPPFLISSIINYVPVNLSQEIVDELNRLNSQGVDCKHIAYTLRLLAQEKDNSQRIRVDAERLVADIALIWYGLVQKLLVPEAAILV